jgi:VanZ family protein
MLIILVIAWLGAITSTHIALPEFPRVEVSDKTLHVGGFSGLTMLFVLTLLAWRRRRIWRIAMTLTLLPAYAALDELTQPYFHRTCDIHDWLSDMAGMLIALAACETLIALVQWKKKATSD